MQKNEKQFLVNEKEINGQARNKAWLEVKNLEEHEKAFKILWNEKKHLELELNKLKEENKKLREQVFRLKFLLEKEKKNDTREIVYKGSLAYLRRIINNMGKLREYSYNFLSKDLLIPRDEIEGLLKFLSEYKVLNLEFTTLGVIRNE